jgi:nucleoside-diphosphate-sugar epimerase
VRWVDLTEQEKVDKLVAAVSPSAIVHLAAIIPPYCYARRNVARAVNVDATAHLVRAAEQQPEQPKFLQASSIAVYGARNPHRINDILTSDTPANPADVYGGHKVEAERIVDSSTLDWLILRLGGVLTTEPNLGMDPDMLYFEGLLPSDGRIQTVDVRDVARAFCAATTADASREILLIGGDASHRLRQGEIGPAAAAALGLVGGLPPGRPGNPDSDTAWFATDWMDTSRSQEVLGFQHYSFPEMMAQTREKSGWKRYPLRIAAPVVREVMRRRAPYYRASGTYADPWNAIRAKWGEPDPDAAS